MFTFFEFRFKWACKVRDSLQTGFILEQSASNYRVDWASFFSDRSNDVFDDDFMFKIGRFHWKNFASRALLGGLQLRPGDIGEVPRFSICFPYRMFDWVESLTVVLDSQVQPLIFPCLHKISFVFSGFLERKKWRNCWKFVSFLERARRLTG